MNTSIICREATREDLPQVLRLHAQPALDNGQILPLEEAEHLFARMQSYPDYKVYVAVHDGVIVGTFSLLVMDNLAHMGAPSAIIEDVAVAPEWQRRGIGRQMVDYALARAAEKSCYKAMLSSSLKREQAHAFYEALGFERHGYSFLIQLPADRAPPDGLSSSANPPSSE